MFEKKFAWGRSFTVLLLLIVSFTMSVGAVSLPPATIASGADLDTFYDHFDDSSINTSLWTTGSFEVTDPLVTVNEVDGNLVVTPRANQTGLHYNGLISSRAYNLTGGAIFVEAVEVTQSHANTMLIFGADNNNKVIMETENGSLLMNLVVGGSRVGAASVAYDGSAHRWWRIRHVTSGDTIRFDTSPDGIAWTQRHSVSRGSLNITSGKVNLSAGTWGSLSNPGRARFDNLSWHPLVPNKGDWSPIAKAISPNPSPGTWDHILWGAASPSTMVKFNGTYFLYYIGGEGDTGNPEYNPIRRSLGVATSSNGIQFTKYGSNPVITYTTTGGAVVEEGVGGATAIVVGSTIHLYYAAIRSTGGEVVDLDVRYRKSTDGYNFTNDTLIYRSSGDEYIPTGVTYNGSAWSVYIKGPLTNGKGPLSRLSGTSPVSLPNKTSVTSTTFGGGGNANYISSNVFVVHLDRRESTEDRFQVRTLNTGSPDAISEPLFSYTFGNFNDHHTPATFKDDASGKWFMYTLDISSEPAVISVRTYTPSNIAAPTSTPMTSSTNTPTPLATSTNAPVAAATSTPTQAFTPTPGSSTASMHVGDIDGTTEVKGKNWNAIVVITIHDNNHKPVANATVNGNWGNAYTGTGSCITNTSGSCTIKSGRAAKDSSVITFTVGSISHSSLPYVSTNNHDPDGDSNGTTITIQKP
jgi:hypothetical protein